MTSLDRSALEERADELVPVLAERLARVRRRISDAGGDPGLVRIVAVTKTFGAHAVLAAVRCGVRDIGENYAGELVEKATALGEPGGKGVTWHFIGQIQRNKVARLAPLVGCWQTISRVVEAETVVRRASDARTAPTALVEVNLAGDPSRPGCDPADLDELVAAVRATGVDLRGLMAVAPLEGDREAAFADLARRGRDLGLAELSMGMSDDLEQAVRSGATMIRVGSALFGPRDHHATRRGLQE